MNNYFYNYLNSNGYETKKFYDPNLILNCIFNESEIITFYPTTFNIIQYLNKNICENYLFDGQIYSKVYYDENHNLHNANGPAVIYYELKNSPNNIYDLIKCYDNIWCKFNCRHYASDLIITPLMIFEKIIKLADFQSNLFRNELMLVKKDTFLNSLFDIRLNVHLHNGVKTYE